MAVVAVSGLPRHFAISALTSLVSKASGERFDDFEVLNFEPTKDGFKTGYVRTSERVDPVRVVEKVNSSPNKFKLKAYIPEEVPDLPMTKRQQKKLKTPETNTKNILPLTHREILHEMQSKFSGLFNLSKKTGHKLLKEIATTIFMRLKQITSLNADAAANCVVLSKCYRKKFPHFGDFQFILSTLHGLQDAAGVPRAQISEEALIAVQHRPYVYDDVPGEKLQTLCKRYSEIISKTISDHIKNLDSEMKVEDSEEEVARKKVRTELKKMAPFMPSIMQQLTTKNFIPTRQPSHRIWMYGEPFLPPFHVMFNFLKRHSAMHQRRSTWIFNMLKFNVLPDKYSSLMAMDGTVINGAKLVIRSCDTPKYKVPNALLQQWLGPSASDFIKFCDTVQVDGDLGDADEEGDGDEGEDQMEE